MPQNDNDHLIEECKRIEDDCLYTAETHYIIAAAAGKAAFWVKLIPAIAAAASGVTLLSGSLGLIPEKSLSLIGLGR